MIKPGNNCFTGKNRKSFSVSYAETRRSHKFVIPCLVLFRCFISFKSS